MTKVSIMGIHEEGGEDILRLPTNGGVIVFTESIGHAPYDRNGRDYRQWSDKGYVPYVRLNNGYYPNGTIPAPADYDDFAIRVVNFIGASQGCVHWIIGNEPNHRVEWPHGDPIHAEDYIKCWNLIQDEMDARFDYDDHPHQLSPGAVAPWNVDSYPQDWVLYFRYLMHECRNISFITMHTYTHGPFPALIASNAKMDSPYDQYYYHFRVYRDFMYAIPNSLADREVIISETNQDAPWVDESGVYWLQEAYLEVDHWNYGVKEGIITGNLIRALCPFRWPKHDDKFIEGKQHVIGDYYQAVALNLTLPETEEEEPVADWNRIFYLDCEGEDYSAFYDQGSIPELTIPIGTRLMWRWSPPEGQLDRPEADWKSKVIGHTEVYEGLWSAVTYDTWSTGQHWYLSDRISVAPGELVRGSVAYMHVFAGQAVGGSQCGIVLGDGPFASGRTQWPVEWENPCESPSIIWGDWRTSRQGVDYLPDQEWAILKTPEVDPQQYTFVRLIVRAHADQRGELSAFHYDNFTVETLTDDSGVEPPVEPPLPVDCTAQVLQDNLRKTALALVASLREAAAVLEVSIEEWE